MSIDAPVDIFQDAIRRLDEAADYIQIDPEALERLKHPKAVIQVSVPVRMDNGSLRIFDAMRVRHDELCADPQGVMDRITDFIGVRRATLPEDFRLPENHIIGNIMRSGSVQEDHSWREELSVSDLATIARICGRLNRGFGFPWPA